jgi:Domain of unknown function (DUF4126)
MLIGLLATLSASAAAGMRIALPLLVIGLLRYNELWSNVPILSKINPKVVIAVLTSWSLFELFGSKKLLGQRILQIIQLIFSPIAGAIMSVSVARIVKLEFTPLWIIGIVGGILALVIKLVSVGWFFRWGKMPIWVTFLEDLLCIVLVLFAFKAPENGGLIAMLLLWLSIRSSSLWFNQVRNKHLKIDH